MMTCEVHGEVASTMVDVYTTACSRCFEEALVKGMKLLDSDKIIKVMSENIPERKVSVSGRLNYGN